MSSKIIIWALTDILLWNQDLELKITISYKLNDVIALPHMLKKQYLTKTITKIWYISEDLEKMMKYHTVTQESSFLDYLNFFY